MSWFLLTYFIKSSKGHLKTTWWLGMISISLSNMEIGEPRLSWTLLISSRWNWLSKVVCTDSFTGLPLSLRSQVYDDSRRAVILSSGLVTTLKPSWRYDDASVYSLAKFFKGLPTCSEGPFTTRNDTCYPCTYWVLLYCSKGHPRRSISLCTRRSPFTIPSISRDIHQHRCSETQVSPTTPTWFDTLCSSNPPVWLP